MNKIDETKARELYTKIMETFSGEDFTKAVELAEEQYSEIVRYYLKNVSSKREALHEVDLQVGKLVAEHELKGFIIGLIHSNFLFERGGTNSEKYVPLPVSSVSKKRKDNAINPKTGHPCRLIEIDGISRNVTQWCKEAGCAMVTGYKRLNRSEEEFIAYIKMRIAANTCE